MALALLVYIVSNLAYNGTFFFWLGVFPLVLWVAKPKDQTKASWLVVGALFMILHVVLPNRDTMIYCASAYMIQTVITNEKTQELSTAAYDATLEQLKEWSKESKDAAKLIAPVLKEKLISTTNSSK